MLAGSFSGMFIASEFPETQTQQWMLNTFVSFWIVSLVLLLPIRVFLDRREARISLAKLEAGSPPEELSPSERASISNQAIGWPADYAGLVRDGLKLGYGELSSLWH